MTPFSIDLVNRDGSVDRYELGDFDCALAASKTAREYLLVSQSAVAAEVFASGALVRRIPRLGDLSHRTA